MPINAGNQDKPCGSRPSRFARGAVAWEGDHVRLVLLPNNTKGLSKEVVAKISACLRRIGRRCVLDGNERARERWRLSV